jgi:pimeloyl-ACP methyl ester carboxylesterase
MAQLKPSKTGLIEVKGAQVWHEIYGEGSPIVLIHGGLMTIPEMSALIEPLAKSHKVVALEMQGHGHAFDTDRPLSFNTFGDDVATVIDTLKLERPDVVGLSFGAAVSLRAAIQHPDQVRRVVVISSPAKHKGWYPKAQDGMAAVDHKLADGLREHTPTGKLAQQWPDPSRFPKFLDKMGKLMGEDYDWSTEIRALPLPVMLVFTDHDSVTQQHVAEFFALLGGGISEPGWQNTKFTKARLAIVPGYSHYNFATSPEIGPIIAKFLADPMIGQSSGAAAASTVS